VTVVALASCSSCEGRDCVAIFVASVAVSAASAQSEAKAQSNPHVASERNGNVLEFVITAIFSFIVRIARKL
jgi:hypothetical protein